MVSSYVVRHESCSGKVLRKQVSRDPHVCLSEAVFASFCCSEVQWGLFIVNVSFGEEVQKVQWKVLAEEKVKRYLGTIRDYSS